MKKQNTIRYRSLMDGTKPGEWQVANSLDEFSIYNYYIVELTHGNNYAGLPIEHCSDEEHYIIAHLLVTDRGTTGRRQQQRVIGQTLVLSNCETAAMNIFTRTLSVGGQNANWSSWEQVIISGKNETPSNFDEVIATLTTLIADLKAESARAQAAEQANAQAIDSETKRATESESTLANSIAKEKTALQNGDTVVALAREVYTRQGKSDSATFLKRTTAGATSVSDGVATLKQIGGNSVKNLVEGTFVGEQDVPTNAGHIYYAIATTYNGTLAFGDTTVNGADGWEHISIRVKATESTTKLSLTGIVVKSIFLTNLTEMYGSGKEPTQETCDGIYSAMGVLPKGLTFAQPTGFTSTGYNQWNPNNVLTASTVSNGVIKTGTNNIAIVECLPCKLGSGENNGYVIGCGEGDDWSDNAIVGVYFTPYNPMDTTQNLQLQTVAPVACPNHGDSHVVYAPQCTGYLLIECQTTNKLCVHFAWSGDRDYRDYEEYVQSNVSLPVIPQMSEWGLAGITKDSKANIDTIDLESNLYTRIIERVILDGSQTWSKRANNKGFFSGSALNNKPAVSTMAITNTTLKVQVGTGDYGTMAVGDLTIYINYNEEVNSLSVDGFMRWLKDNPIIIYYVLKTPEKYPIVAKNAPNYVASDYGVEKFSGSNIPLNGNILFYIRSLVGETKNFLDRLQKSMGLSDVTLIADEITNTIEIVKHLSTADT